MVSSGQKGPILAQKPQIPAPPKRLRAAGRQFWSDVWEAFLIEAHQVPLVLYAAIQADRADQAARRLRKATSARATERALAAERAAQKAFLLTRRELALDTPSKEARGPRLGGRYA